MKKTPVRKLAHVLLAGLTSLSVTGCDALLDNALDCLDSDGPEFDKRTIETPVLNQVYQDVVSVRIENEPRDDRFSYDIRVQGSLPAGLIAEQVPSTGRQLFISGTPTELGMFSFTLFVAVENGVQGFSDTSGLCYTTRSRIFEVTVAPM